MPTKIVGGILQGITNTLKSLFIPDENYFTERFTNLENTFTQKLGYDLSFMDSVKGAGVNTLENININIMGVSATVIDFKYLNTALSNIRPWIQSFIYFMLALYNVNSIYKLIRGTNLVDIRNTVSNMKGDD